MSGSSGASSREEMGGRIIVMSDLVKERSVFTQAIQRGAIRYADGLHEVFDQGEFDALERDQAALAKF